MVIPTNTGAPPPPPTITIVAANSSEPEQLSCGDADDYSPGNPRSSFYFSPVESGLSARTTECLRDGEGSDEDECIEQFFTDENGQPLRITPSNSPIDPRHSMSQSSIRSNCTTASLVSYGVLQLPLEDFCDLIREHRSLQKAEILSTETHCKMNGPVPHRFLLLELRRERSKDLWLRLDRRRDRDVPFIQFATRLETPSHDMARLAGSRNRLVGNNTLENRQLFSRNPTLSELEHLLDIFKDITYRLLSTNCWFLPSQLQEHLGTRNGGDFVIGSQMHSRLAPDDRVRIAQRLASFDVPSSSSHPLLRVRSLGTISVKATIPPLQNLPVVPRRQRSTDMLNSTNETRVEVVGQQQTVPDVDEILHRFQKTNHDIRTLSDTFAEHIDRLRQSPVNKGPPWVVPKGHLLCELSGGSVTVEDYAYFTARFIMNREIYNGIFMPIHPAVAEDKARPYGRQLDSVPPADAMIVRARLFRHADPKISVDRGSECIWGITKTIQTEILGAIRGLGSLDGKYSLFPPSFTTNLEHIVQSAYEWNRMIKQNIGRYAFTPFLVNPLSEWNLERMESFERLPRMHVPMTGSKIIYPLSLGIMGSRSPSVGEGNTSNRPSILYVQRKAQVLVKEWWFRKDSTPPKMIIATALPLHPPVRSTSPSPSAPSSRGTSRTSGTTTTTTITITAQPPNKTRKVKPKRSMSLLRSGK